MASNFSKFTLTLALTLFLALAWVLSFRSVRIKIGDYYYNQGKFDQAVGWYAKAVRNESLKVHPNKEDRLKYEEDSAKLKSSLASFVSQARHHLNRINSSFTPVVPDFESLDRAMTEYSKIMQFYESYRRTSIFNVGQIADTLNEILNEIKKNQVDTCLAFGEKCIQANMWREAKFFFTKRILIYMNPIDALEKLDKVYGNNFKIKEKIWGNELFVTLEDFEDSATLNFTHFASMAPPTVHLHTKSAEVSRTGNYSEYFDLSYGKSGYDYWAKSVNIPLSNPDLVLGVRLFIKSKERWRGFLKINIVYPTQGITGICQTYIHENTMDGWEELRIDNLYEKARLIAFQQSWDMNGATIDNIIIDTQGFSNEFYLDDVELYLIKN